MKTQTLVILGLIGFMAVATWYFIGPTILLNQGTACTAEAKICPDGTSVGRTGPNCEFAPCPTGETGEDQGILPYNSGIQGMIVMGPTCPVERPEEPCPPAPYQTVVAIFREVDAVHAFAIVESDAQGKFRVSLPPGRYDIGAGESNLPRCPTTPVIVPPNEYAEITINCDTGIR